MSSATFALLKLASFVPLLIATRAMANAGDVQTAWRLLYHVAIDCGGAVEGGRVKSAAEYAKMKSAHWASSRLAAPPPKSERAALIAGAASTRDLIARRGTPQEVATLARGLAADLLAAGRSAP